MKKRGIVILALFLVLFSFSVNSQTADLQGVNICNVPYNCEPVIPDGICPEDFATGRVCAVQDADCVKCVINKDKTGWSASSTNFEPISEVKSGVPVYMYAETTGCSGKDAVFTIEGVKLFSSKLLSLQLPSSKVQNNKAVKEITFIFDEVHSITGGGADVFNKYKFTVKINPTETSNTLDVIKGNIKGQQLIDKSCSDGYDNDGDTCVDSDDPDCQTGGKNSEDSGSINCPATTTGACAGWSCTYGDCVDGFKSLKCNIPQGCTLPPPPSSVKCYQSSEAFPFFTNFNAAIVIFLLAAYYGYRIYKKKK
ncbi:hypothetical protein HYX16_03700 [Candidatus Woesearchaeota archaeon]|nr:hypothetical protein [Candidatus Woesearchaeota archaeon]